MAKTSSPSISQFSAYNAAFGPVRADRQGITHFAHSWGETYFDILCEVYTTYGPRSGDEPAGTVPTCLRCWYYIMHSDRAEAAGLM